MDPSRNSGQTPRGESIRVTVRAENPASRIQVTDREGQPLLRVPATGQARLSLRGGVTYLISHWVGSGEQHVREWNLDWDGSSEIVLPDDTIFISAQPLPNSDGQDEEALRFAGQSLPSDEGNVNPQSHRAIYLSARIRHAGVFGIRRRDDFLASLQAVNIGWLNNDEYHARIPRPIGKPVLESPNALLEYDIKATRDGMPMLAIAPPFQSSAWMFRALPVLERRFPRVFLCSIIGPQESAGLLDWRRARYSLYSTLDPDNRYLPTRESRYEEGLIERLGRPGVVSSAVRQFIQGRQSGNVLAQIAGWLLCARRHRPAFLRRHDLLDAFARWRGANISLLSIPDISLLEYLWEADEFKYINLSAPVFSASWRLLAHIPSSAWLESKVGIDPLSWRMANSANLGGVWFSWTPGQYRSLEPEDAHLNGRVAKAPQAFIRLVQRVQEAVRESDLNTDRFSQIVDWSKRTLLERRILDQILARGSIVPEHEGVAEQTLDEFARVLGFPLPIIALSVGKLAGQEWITENPPPAPSNLPTTTALPESVQPVRREVVYATSLGLVPSVGMSAQSHSLSPSLTWTYPNLRDLLR